ncbi:MAG TPA: tail fiber domain-containing protein [Chitinophagaceae bacterium]|nr:tail fiber domain-containing protein [Chitinophagaceae bacterium]
MKKIVILSLIISNYFIANSQNVGIGTLTPAGKLHIKGGADTSQLVIDANVVQSNTHPLIRLRNAAGTDILHIHSDDASNVFIGLGAGKFNNAAVGGTSNTFIGSAAGYYNIHGNDNTANGNAALYFNANGSNNTANGNAALHFNNFGDNNTASGYEALYSNASGDNNIAMGDQALFSNTLGVGNTATGSAALFSNTTASLNTANGNQSLYHNTTGVRNTSIGFNALFNNITGNFNTAVGGSALIYTTASDYNTALGYNAGSAYDNGYNNVFLGANVDVNGAGYYNVIAIGQGTICTASSQVTIGNGATNSYRAYANWSNISDGRFKKNVQDNVPGLDFITRLRPVTYNLNAIDLDVFLHKNNNITTQQNKEQSNQSDVANAAYNKALQEKENTTYTGFVAQDVEATAKQLGFKFSGVDAPKDANDVYGLRYAEFVVPLVKAVQEQQVNIERLTRQIEIASSAKMPATVVSEQQIIEELKKENETQKSFNNDLQKQIDQLKTLIKK